MDVILLQDVEKIGLRGDVVSVSRGYMRNYLQPRRLAEPATPALVAELEKREAQRARHEARSAEQAQEIAETLRKTVLRFEVKSGPRGRLFGSVTPTNIVDELWRTRKIRVDRRKIDLPETIKRIGEYAVPVTVFEDVRADVKTLVVPEGGELPSDDEIAAWEAEERAEAAAAAGITETPAAEGEPGQVAADEAEAVALAGAGEEPADVAAAEPPSEEAVADEVEAAWDQHETGVTSRSPEAAEAEAGVVPAADEPPPGEPVEALAAEPGADETPGPGEEPGTEPGVEPAEPDRA